MVKLQEISYRYHEILSITLIDAYSQAGFPQPTHRKSSTMRSKEKFIFSTGGRYRTVPPIPTPTLALARKTNRNI
jgi:hypothetical protein